MAALPGAMLEGKPEMKFVKEFVDFRIGSERR